MRATALGIISPVRLNFVATLASKRRLDCDRTPDLLKERFAERSNERSARNTGQRARSLP